MLGHPREGTQPHTYTLNPTPYTLHPTPYTLHPSTLDLQPTHSTLHTLPYTPHLALLILQPTEPYTTPGKAGGCSETFSRMAWMPLDAGGDEGGRVFQVSGNTAGEYGVGVASLPVKIEWTDTLTVTFSPGLDKVRVAVRLYDSSGLPTPSTRNLKPETRNLRTRNPRTREPET